jgi:hypothetical protein
VTPTDNVTDEGFGAISIQNQVANFFYQKEEGAFSSIVDNDGNDWVSWNGTPGSGSSGEFRGVANLGPIGFHPGVDHNIETVIVSHGPLKATIESTDPDGNKLRWEFYPTFVRATVLHANVPYYFLYEGTPGGSVNDSDTVVRSDGTVTPIDETWNDTDGLGSGNGQEWAYFRDSAVASTGRYIYFVHNSPDDIEDSYFDLDNAMTVFGFGRHNNPGANPDQLLTAAPNVFTIGLADGGADVNAASATINGAYRELTLTAGSPASIA